MKPPVVFLNELSCGFEKVHPEKIPSCIDESVKALQAASKVRGDLVLGAVVSISDLLVGENHQPIAAINRTALRYFMGLARSNPWSHVIKNETAGLMAEVRHEDVLGVGLTWADKEKTVTVSFGHAAPWDHNEIPGVRYSIDTNGKDTYAPVNIPNLSVLAHVDTWRDLLRDQGFEESASSVIYRGDGFIVRMFLNDHEPPHVHVMPLDSYQTLGKLRLDTLEMLDKPLPTDIGRAVTSWAAENKDELLRSWARCRSGKLPYNFGDKSG